MGTLAAAFTIAWIAITAYVTWLGVRQRELARRLEKWESAAGKRSAAEEHRARAA